MTGLANLLKTKALVAMTSLATALFREARINESLPLNPFTATWTPPVVVISWIYYFPHSWRTLVVDFCRIQVPLLHNRHL